VKKEEWIKENYKEKWELYDYVEKRKSEGVSEEQAIEEVAKQRIQKEIEEIQQKIRKIDEFFVDVKNVQDFTTKKEMLHDVCRSVDVEVREFASEATLRKYFVRLQEKKEEFVNKIENRKTEEYLQILKERVCYNYKHAKYLVFEQILFGVGSEITCDDDIIPVLHQDFVLVPCADEGDFSKRFATRWWIVLDEGEINGKKAVLFETGITSYRDYKEVDERRKRWMVWWENGRLNLKQIDLSCWSVKEALAGCENKEDG